MTTDFFSRFLESGNYKIQIVARVGRKSAVVLSGAIGGFLLSFFYRARFQLFQLLKSSPIKKREQEASISPESTTADFLPTRATTWILYFPDSRNLEKKSVVV